MHTVGPWKVVETDASGELEFYILPMGDGPAIVSGLMHHGRRLEESRANAALLTAAPDLYDAARDALSQLEGLGFKRDGVEVGMLLRAIRKANGHE